MSNGMQAPWDVFAAQRPAERPRMRIAESQWQDSPIEETPIDDLTGDVRLAKGFASRHLGHDRDLWIYLPPGYHQSDARYPVLYMHDGNNLFDPRAAFGGQDWGVNETAEWMIRAGLLAPMIIVGAANSPDRLSEYTWHACPRHGGGGGEAYGRFLREELKPAIDAHYRTVPAREATAVMGSSLGGLLSLYLGLHHADVFGVIGAMSPSLWWADRRVLGDMAGLDPTLRMWLDMGTAEGASPEESARYLADARALRDQLVSRGFALGQNLTCWEVEGASHSEAAWGSRASMALMFLFGPRRDSADAQAA
jgi:predicted alpha/beta superfamily hydrolase